MEVYFGLKTKKFNDYFNTIEPFIEFTKEEQDDELIFFNENKKKESLNDINKVDSIHNYYRSCEEEIKNAKNFYFNMVSNNRIAIRKTTKKTNENNPFEPLDVNMNMKNQINNSKGDFSNLDNFRRNIKYNKFSLNYNLKNNVFEYSMLIRPYQNIVESYTDLISLIIFTDVNIYEKNPINEIFGRVNRLGGKIALISLNNELDSETIITCLHETIHTFGISHCNEWDCIMNPKNDINGYSSIDICPLDLMKLKLYNNDIDIINRFKDLKEIYKKFYWDQDVKDCEEKINLYEVFFGEEEY